MTLPPIIIGLMRQLELRRKLICISLHLVGLSLILWAMGKLWMSEATTLSKLGEFLGIISRALVPSTWNSVTLPTQFTSAVRPVLEYAGPVWQNIPAYLTEAIERVQKRALNIIYSEAESYAHALQLGKLDRLDDTRVHLCYKYMAKMKSPSHPCTTYFPAHFWTHLTTP